MYKITEPFQYKKEWWGHFAPTFNGKEKQCWGTLLRTPNSERKMGTRKECNHALTAASEVHFR